MQPKERILAVLNRRPVDRLPVDLWHTPEIVAALRLHTGTNDDFGMWQALGLDKIVWDFVGYKSAGAQPGALTSGARTMWGAELREIQAGAAGYAEVKSPPMAGYDSVAQLDDYPFWPSPDGFDYDEGVALAERASQHFAVIGPWVSLFEIHCQLRGLEQAMIDLAADPDFVEASLDRIEAIQTEMMKRFFARAAKHLDLAFISEDIGGQNGLLLSPAAWRRHLKPRLTRWCRLIHDHGLKVFYHSDGGFEALIPELIDCGIDVLNPIQHICPGMDTAELKRKYGDRIIFHGGVDNQHVLPFGKPEDVRREVRMLLDTLGGGRQGFICSSCHNVQAGTPVENVVAMVDAVCERR